MVPPTPFRHPRPPIGISSVHFMVAPPPPAPSVPGPTCCSCLPGGEIKFLGRKVYLRDRCRLRLVKETRPPRETEAECHAPTPLQTCDVPSPVFAPRSGSAAELLRHGGSEFDPDQQHFTSFTVVIGVDTQKTFAS